MIISIKEECRRYLITGKEGSYAKGGPTLYTRGAKICGHLYTERFRSMHSGWTMHIAGSMQRRVGVGVGGGYSVCTIIHVVLGYTEVALTQKTCVFYAENNFHTQFSDKTAFLVRS